MSSHSSKVIPVVGTFGVFPTKRGLKDRCTRKCVLRDMDFAVLSNEEGKIKQQDTGISELE